MQVLGRHLPQPFDDFWAALGSEIAIPANLIALAHPSVFRDQAWDPDFPDDLPSWLSLPPGPLAYHVAHELTHTLLLRRGYPRSLRGLPYPPDSPEARVGADLEEMLHHHALESVLKPFPFERWHIQEHLYNTARKGLETAPVPQSGSLWWATWALRHCELQFHLPPDKWRPLDEIYQRRCPDIAAKGRELTAVLDSLGSSTPDSALQSMIKVRDALGLKENQICLVLDPRSKQTF
jgi:hypothetical protein